MSAEVPEDGEIWQDGEGMLFYIVDDGRRAALFGSSQAWWIEHLDPRDKPSERVFDADGKYTGTGILNRESEPITREEIRRRQKGYAERCHAAGLDLQDNAHHDHGDHNHQMVLVEIGPDGVLHHTDPSSPDVPDVIRRMVQAAQDVVDEETAPNTLGSPRGPFG